MSTSLAVVTACLCVQFCQFTFCQQLTGSRWERGAGRGNAGKDGRERGVGRETKGPVGRRQRDEGAGGT
jgi:hypothetical protein